MSLFSADCRLWQYFCVVTRSRSVTHARSAHPPHACTHAQA